MERQALSKGQQTTSRSNNLQKQSVIKSDAKHPMVALQQSIGNRAVQRLINSRYIQAKLQVGPPGDQYEQEADRVADTVMRMPDPHTSTGVNISNRTQISRLHRKCTECEEEMQRQPVEEQEEETLQGKRSAVQTPVIQRLCSRCQDKLQRQPLEEEETPLEKQPGEDEGLLQGKTEGGDGLEVSRGLETQIENLRGGGQPLPESVRAHFEPRFGHDFSGVRLHTGSQAAQLARSVNAHAFTVGRDIAFGAGQYSPETSGGQRLLAHELTHVVQQTGGAPVTSQGQQNPSVQKSPDMRIMREGFESTVQICHRVLESRYFEVKNGGVRVVLILKPQDTDVPNCRDFDFGVTLTQSEDWWPDNEIGTCEATSGGTRSFSFGNLSAGTYYLTIWRIFDHPYCCLEGDILVFDEAISADSSGCTRDKDPSVMDIIHGALDIAGFIPALGAIPDGINAVIYAVEGDWTNAGISAIAMVPAFGDGAKLGIKGGQEVVQASQKTIYKMGEEELAAGLKKAAKEKAEKEAAEKAAKLEKEAAERAEKEAAEKAEKEAAEKEAAEKKKKEKKKETCATKYPGLKNCSSLPFDYVFPSAQAALTVLKAETGNKNLRLHNPSPATGGPCPGVGTHYNVRDGSTRIASIGCCPCCKDTPLGPVKMTLCRIIY